MIAIDANHDVVSETKHWFRWQFVVTAAHAERISTLLAVDVLPGYRVVLDGQVAGLAVQRKMFGHY